jgi:gluconokinase
MSDKNQTASDKNQTAAPAQGVQVVIVLGVAGSGKSTIGRMLAQQLGWEFADADDFHTPQAKAKMSRGVGLGDEDRRPWLNALRELISQRLALGRGMVLACSALKQWYRDVLVVDRSREALVYLRGDFELIRQRLAARSGHYAGVSLLASQVQTLEEPHDAIAVDIAQTPAEIVAAIRAQLHL